MTKDRRDELREALDKEDLPGWKTEFILLIHDEDAGLYLDELRALLDDSERLEALVAKVHPPYCSVEEMLHAAKNPWFPATPEKEPKCDPA